MLTITNPIYSILYIDEAEQNLISFKSSFGEDYHIYTASSGLAGLEIMEQTTIQLVITDQRIPDMSGIEFLEKILLLYPDCMRMIMTGTSDTDDIIEAINKGNIFRFVTKPWSREDLKLLTAQHKLATDPKGWVKSSDITVPLPTNKAGVIWSKEGILSGEYDKLQPTAKQWYLHTHGPIKIDD